jgi:hypothetical protein
MTSAINLLPVTTTPVIRVCGVSMGVSFYGGSKETIGGRVRLRRPEISPFRFEVVLAALEASYDQGVVWGVYGRVFSWRYRQMCPISVARDNFVLVLAASRASGSQIRVCEVSKDVSFHGGSNDTIGGRSDSGGRIYCSLLMAASLFLPSGSQSCRKNRPLSSQQSTTPAIKFVPKCR